MFSMSNDALPVAFGTTDVPDHSEIDYPEFRKEFYVEVPEIAKMPEHEVADFRHDNEGESYSIGVHCFTPIDIPCDKCLRLIGILCHLAAHLAVCCYLNEIISETFTSHHEKLETYVYS